jgi:hypothetical protein
MPLVFDTNALLRPAFSSDTFTATKGDSGEVKAEFVNKLCRFMAADFKEPLFTKVLYRRLSLCFGHIAHYNSLGFFEHFFHDLQGKVAFLEETLLGGRAAIRPTHTATWSAPCRRASAPAICSPPIGRSVQPSSRALSGKCCAACRRNTPTPPKRQKRP